MSRTAGRGPPSTTLMLATSSWLVDASKVSEAAYLRVSNTTVGNVDVKITSAAFSVRPAAGFGSFIAPVSTDRWAIGGTATIEWVTGGVVTNNFKIEYSTSGAYTTIYTGAVTAVSKVAGENWYEDKWSYEWSVPSVVAFPSNTVQVRVTNIDKTSVFGTSATFAISRPYIAITSPIAGSVWVSNETNDITWKGFGEISSVYWTQTRTNAIKRNYTGRE